MMILLILFVKQFHHRGPAIHDNSLQLTLLELGLVNYVKSKPITESICFYLQAISHQGIDYVAKSGASFPWEKKLNYLCHVSVERMQIHLQFQKNSACTSLISESTWPILHELPKRTLCIIHDDFGMQTQE